MKKLFAVVGCTAFMGVAAAVVAQDQPVVKRPMRTFDTPYYTLTTDIDEATAREADLRMTRMFEEYRRRTAAFSAEPKGKFPFFLFSNEADYYAAGGIKDSAGTYQFFGGRLLGCARPGQNAWTWHIVQHEGFHQFAAMTIHMELPTWLNEGLAEYFGEAIFTGDCFIVGAIPSPRLEDIKKEIAEKKWKSFAAITRMSLEQWNKEMGGNNYDQAWAMVYFLVHGEDGKYLKAFDQYLMMMNRGTMPEEAWAEVFGKDVAAFQKKCEKWWTDLPENPTREAYSKALVATMTSLLARQELQKRKIEDFDGLLAAPPPTDVKLGRDLWLPPSLVDGMEKVARHLTWTLDRPKGQMPRLSCEFPQVGLVSGTFTLSGNRVDKVIITVNKETASAAPQSR